MALRWADEPEDYDYYESGDYDRDRKEQENIHRDAFLETYGRDIADCIRRFIHERGPVQESDIFGLAENIVYDVLLPDDLREDGEVA